MSRRILQHIFFEWTVERVTHAAGIFALFLFVVFAWLNIGSGPTQEIYGTVRDVGMDTGTSFTLPRLVASVVTEEGNIVSIKIPSSVSVTKETKLILGKRSRLFTDGYEYEFLRLVTGDK